MDELDRPGDPETGVQASGPSAPAQGGLSRAGAWNLSFNVLSKTQTLSLLIAGSIIGGFEAIGVAVTAMGSCYVGGALADLGLGAELSRLSIAHPNRGTVNTSLRAIARQAPLALFFAPPIFYAVLGHRTGASLALLLTIGALGALLTATTQLTAVLNGLGDFRSPAAWLGGGRLVSSIAAVAAVAVEPSVIVVLGSFALGECVGLIALVVDARRTRARLPEATEHVAIRRTHVWLGAAAVSNVVTRQSDTILVAGVLPAEQLGLYATASALVNGVNTFSLAMATPFTFRSIGTTLRGDSGGGAKLLRKAVAIAGGGACVLAILTWGLTQLLGDTINDLSGLTAGDGSIVLALCLGAGALSASAQVFFWIGIGFARHRAVGTSQVLGGVVGGILIIVAAALGGVVAAAAATIARDGILLLLGRRVAAPPRAGESPPAPPAELELELELSESEVA